MKQEFKPESYLTSIEIKKFRQGLSRFRLSNTNLLIELGRHINIPIEDRVCQYCKTKGIEKVENEFHVFTCERYNDIREFYIGNFVQSDANIYEIVLVFKSEDKNTLKSLAMFIYYMLQRERQLF